MDSIKNTNEGLLSTRYSTDNWSNKNQNSQTQILKTSPIAGIDFKSEDKEK